MSVKGAVNDCRDCGRKFKRRHTCFGRGHRRRVGTVKTRRPEYTNSKAKGGIQRVPTDLTLAFPLQRIAQSPNSSDISTNGDIASLTWPVQLPNHLRANQEETILSTGPHSLPAPNDLLVQEKLLRDIKDYFEMSCRSMKFDKYGDLLAQDGANLISDFDSFCFTATVFNKKELHDEFRRAISRATALVVQILQVEHPRTLACFFEVFIHFIQNGLPDATSYFRDIIKHLSANRKGLWARICRLLCAPDSEHLDQALAQAWRCITDTFDTELGTSSRLAVSVRLDYIKRVYGAANFREEELLLRNILTQFGTPKLPTPRVMLNLAHNLNRQGKYYEAEEMALEVYLLLKKHDIYARRVVEKIESLKIISHSQFNLRNAAAEQTMLDAIQMIVDHWGIHHSWVPEFMNVLEGWLRGWGRVGDADILRGKIDVLVGKDEVDKRDQSS